VLEGKDGAIEPTTETHVLTEEWNVLTVVQPSSTSPVDCHFQTICFIDELDVACDTASQNLPSMLQVSKGATPIKTSLYA